jgi:hypothetical protein
MGPLLTIILLIVFGIVAFYLSTYILNIAGLPGALLAKGSEKNDGLFLFGSFISAIGQSFIYLAYISFIVRYALESANFFVWIFAFLSAMGPIIQNTNIAEREAKEDGYYTNPQIKGLNISIVISLIAFFVFAFNPDFMESIYGWVSNII